MPQYDLAGNPLPESGGSSAPQSAPPLGPGMPRPGAPPSYGVLPAYTPPSLDAPVRRDLAGNPLPDSAPPPPPSGAPRPEQMPGQMPGQMPQPRAWPPPPVGTPQSASPYGMPPARNTSGSQGDVPPEIARLKWNWGAFCIPRLWCYRHGLPAVATALWVTAYLLRFLHSFAPPVQVQIFTVLYYIADYGLAIYLGFQGNRMAWRNRHFPGGVEEFFKVQRAWMVWGLLWQVLVVSFLGWLFWYIQATPQLSAPAGGAYSAPNGSGPGGQ